MCGHRRLHGRLDRLLVADIASQRQDAPGAQAEQLVPHRPVVLAQVDQGQARARGGEAAGGGQADAAQGAGDDDAAILELRAYHSRTLPS